MGKTRECRPPSPPAPPVGRARGAGRHVTDDNTNGIGTDEGSDYSVRGSLCVSRTSCETRWQGEDRIRPSVCFERRDNSIKHRSWLAARPPKSGDESAALQKINSNTKRYR